MFKVGDFVIINPKYLTKPYGFSNPRGIITSNTSVWNSNYNVIDWEDGTTGETDLNRKSPYLLLV
jgi:hypothetical protein